MIPACNAMHNIGVFGVVLRMTGTAQIQYVNECRARNELYTPSTAELFRLVLRLVLEIPPMQNFCDIDWQHYLICVFLD